MLYISVRLIVVALVAVTTLVVGGSAVPSVDKPSPKASSAWRSTVAVAPPPDPATLHGEMPNTSSDQQKLTLGSGERLDGVIWKAVQRMDKTLTSSQVSHVVQTLMDDIQAEAPAVDLEKLNPGVSVQISRRSTAGNGTAWDAYLGKYSGIAQEGG